MRNAALLLLLLLLAASPALPASADCRLHKDDHIVLASSTDDPDVLVWDSRVRLREYHTGSFDEAQELSPHALLVSQGTHAIVQACYPNYVQSPHLDHPEDAIGVIIVTGPNRGGHGWVLGSDVRFIARPH
jgi:hypothetical protein